MRNWVKALAAGGLSILSAQQLALAMLQARGLLTVETFDLRSTALLGAPLFVMQTLSGIVWAPLLWWLVRRAEAAGYYVGAALLGAALPSLAALLLCSLLIADPAAVFVARTVEIALILGASWGLGFAIWMRLLRLLP